MNNLSLTIVTLIHYNVIVRDTLEYAIEKDVYSKEAYEMKKKGVLIELEKPTALKQFLDQNKELGKKIEEEVKGLYAAVYADDSTICRLANNELRVDASQHLAIYDNVFDLHENVRKVIDGHIGFARSKNMFEDELFKLIVADERMYRAIAFHCLYRDLEKLFVEYNKARNEAKGEITPQSNFVQGELQRVVKHIQYIKEHQAATDNEYWDVVDYVIKTVDWTSGKRQLPAGKNFQQCFEEGRKLITAFLTKTENAWKPLYESAINQLIAESKKNNGQIGVKIENNNKEVK